MNQTLLIPAQMPGLSITTLGQGKMETQKPLHLTLQDLEPGQCRFPFGDAAPYTFCGCPVHADGKPYCAEHHALTHQPVRPHVEKYFRFPKRAA